jgi:hypothetical protein
VLDNYKFTVSFHIQTLPVFRIDIEQLGKVCSPKYFVENDIKHLTALIKLATSASWSGTVIATIDDNSVCAVCSKKAICLMVRFLEYV